MIAPGNARQLPLSESFLMPGFGEYLRREREMRGVTLQEIAETTKISTRFLTALEQEHFSVLPGGIFTRSFIRAYAQYLGLDDEHVLAEYRRAAHPPNDIDLARLTVTRPLPQLSGSRARAVPWVVAAVLLVGGYAVYRFAHRPAPLPAASALPIPAPPSTAAASSPPSNSSAPPGAQTASGAGGGPASGAGSPASAPALQSSSAATGGTEPASQPAVGNGDLVLQVSTTEEAWLAITADGKTLMQGLLPANSLRVFRAKDSFDITTGNAQGTILTLNGEQQKSLGRPGEFKRIHLSRSDFPHLTN
jgi:cytoskeleton protein RodZ